MTNTTINYITPVSDVAVPLNLTFGQDDFLLVKPVITPEGEVLALNVYISGANEHGASHAFMEIGLNLHEHLEAEAEALDRAQAEQEAQARFDIDMDALRAYIAEGFAGVRL